MSRSSLHDRIEPGVESDNSEDTDFEVAESSEESTHIASVFEGQGTASASHHAKFLMIELTGTNLTWDERKDEPWTEYRDNVAKKFKQ